MMCLRKLFGLATAFTLSMVSAVQAAEIQVNFTAQLSAIPGTAFVGGDDSGLDGATMTLTTTFADGTVYQTGSPVFAQGTNKWEMTLTGSAVDGTYQSSGNARWIADYSAVTGGNAFFGADVVSLPEFDLPVPGQSFSSTFRLIAEFVSVAVPSVGDLLDVSQFSTALAPSNTTFMTNTNATNGQQYNLLNASLIATDMTSGLTNHDTAGSGGGSGGGSTSVPLPSTIWLASIALLGLRRPLLNRG